MENTITLVLEKEATQEIINGLSLLIEFADDYDLLTPEQYHTLDDLKDTLIFKTEGR